MNRLCMLLLAVIAMMLLVIANAEITAEQIGDYLYYLQLDDYVPQTVLEAAELGVSGGCTSIRNGNLYGRNLDLNYSDIPEFLVRLSATEERLASIGLCANPYITTDANAMTQEELLSMPSITNDGINEKGVIVSVNVVIPLGVDDRNGTAPGKEKLQAPFVVRYLLDRAESAEQAVELLKEIDIFGGFENYSLHWMIADADNTFIVEIINGDLVVSRNAYMYMTNFYMTLDECMDCQTVAGHSFENMPKLNDYAIGVERYAFVQANYGDTATEDGMLSLLRDVRATAVYHTEPEHRWYTEFTNEELPIMSSIEAYEEEYQVQRYRYAHRDRQNPQGDWITWHTSIYDIAERTLTVYSQEAYDYAYCFELD